MLEYVLIFLFAFFCEFVDASLGMGYGTILSPVLIIIGYSPVIVIPSILLSQAIGGSIASIFHHREKNSIFTLKNENFKVVLLISILGVFAICFSSYLGTIIPKKILKTYIGTLVFVMGIIISSNIKFKFTWRKILGLGLISAFNKGLSGGGFGPVTTAGQIIIGRNHKESVGVTTFSEVFICLAGFLVYNIVGHVNNIIHYDVNLLLCLIFGCIFAAPAGVKLTKILPKRIMKHIMGILAISLGCWTLIKTWL